MQCVNNTQGDPVLAGQSCSKGHYWGNCQQWKKDCRLNITYLFNSFTEVT